MPLIVLIKSILTAVDGIRLLVRNLDAELFLDRHHDLDGIQAIQAQVILEVRCACDLYLFVNKEMGLDDSLNGVVPLMGRTPVQSLVTAGTQHVIMRTLSKFFNRSIIRPCTSSFDRPDGAE